MSQTNSIDDDDGMSREVNCVSFPGSDVLLD